jgi:hypothetical protein
MRSIAAAGRIVALGVVAGVCLSAPVEAATISIVPGSQNAVVGAPVSVDIVVSGLAADESVGGASFTVGFNDAILQGTGVVIDPNDKMGVDLDVTNVFDDDFGAGGTSPLTLVFLADVSLDHDALKLLQGATFTLATVTLDAIGAGLSNLTLGAVGGAFLSNADGLETIPTQAVNGEVCVSPAGTPDLGCAVAAPEPGLMALLGAGLGALAVRRRKAVSRA